MFRNIRHFWRLIYIGSVCLIHRSNLAKAFELLGPAFIKLGQFLSTRPDLIGQEFANNLCYLRDKLPSFPFREVRKIVKSEFGKEIEELYSEFYEIPIAAASIAQVHKATTLDGKEVAVKVRRPNIDKVLKKEIAFFYFVAKIVEGLFSKYKRLKLKEVVKTIERSFNFELDLSFEAAAADELAQKNKLDFVYIPKVDWLRTSHKIFTMEWIDAVSIYEKDKLIEANIDLSILATNFVVMFFSQAFVDGFFHADLHQGNIMVNKSGQIILLDFGIMGRLDYNNRAYIAQILHGFLKKDYDSISKIHLKAGYVSKKIDPQVFAQACRAVGEPIMNLSPEQISIAKLLSHLFKITEDFQMETQPQLLLLQKTMIMVEGIGKVLCNDKNLWILAEPWINQWAQENLSKEAKIAKLIRKMVDQIIEKIKEEL
ncbi:MAG: 2-polyprenylphenol 6-hydroxylase [Rickettsiales bacterium]